MIICTFFLTPCSSVQLANLIHQVCTFQKLYVGDHCVSSTRWICRSLHPLCQCSHITGWATHIWASPDVLGAGFCWASFSLGGCELSFRGLLVKTRWGMRSLSCREAVKEASTPVLPWEWRWCLEFLILFFLCLPSLRWFLSLPWPQVVYIALLICWQLLAAALSW